MADRKDQTEALQTPEPDRAPPQPDDGLTPVAAPMDDTAPDTESSYPGASVSSASDTAPPIEDAEIVGDNTLRPDPDAPAADTATLQEAQPPEPPAPATKTIVERRGGFVPLLLGGVAAAAIGFAMARFVLPADFPFAAPGQSGLSEALTAAVTEAKNADLILDRRIAALESAPATDDLVVATAAANQTASDAMAQIAALADRLDRIEARVTDLAANSLTNGASPAAVAAYEAELAKLQTAMAEQRASLAAMVTEATAQRNAAQMTEQEAMVRNSITRIRIALENGGAFADDLANLTEAGVDVPAALADRAAAGVPTLAALRDAYPDAARAALAAARAGGTTGGIGSVLTSLLGARSLEPRAGDDPDAILSRAEAALRAGRMTDAIAEVDTLPEVARIEMNGWLTLATERATALAALDALAAQATAN